MTCLNSHQFTVATMTLQKLNCGSENRGFTFSSATNVLHNGDKSCKFLWTLETSIKKIGIHFFLGQLIILLLSWHCYLKLPFHSKNCPNWENQLYSLPPTQSFLCQSFVSMTEHKYYLWHSSISIAKF